MTGLPFYEAFAPARLRTIDACVSSAVQALREDWEAEVAARQWQQEQPTDVRNLVGEEVRAVFAHPHGWSIRFGSGACIVIPAGVASDAAGLAVIEP